MNGILEAFSMGTECKETDMTVTHVEKADTELRGLYNYLEKEFLLHSYPETGLVNREDDMGLENLRRTKRACIRYGWRRNIRSWSGREIKVC